MKKMCEQIEVEEMSNEREPDASDLREFKLHCRYWMQTLGLHQYSLVVFIDPMLDRVGAYTQMNHDEAQMSIALGMIDDAFGVGYLARHEMLEVLLEPLYETMTGFVNDRVAQRRGHEVIFRLEKVMPIPTDEEVGIMGKKKKEKKGKKKEQTQPPIAPKGGKKGDKKGKKKGK